MRMRARNLAARLAGLVCALALTGPAGAVTVTRADGQPIGPNGEPFSASGMTKLAKNQMSAYCLLGINGTITPTGAISITSMRISGDGICGLITSTASGVAPWSGQAVDTTHVVIYNAGLQFTLLGGCGPTMIGLQWSDAASSLGFNGAVLQPDCRIESWLVTSPLFHFQ
jgi:hypothetical protein